MLDVISGGRIISGFVRGIGAEYHSFGMDPSQSRDRFYEAHDLIVAAWTRPGPFEWYGKHYKFRYVNPWPRPLQQPHPPIWSPSQGSGETVDWAARNRYTYLQTYSDIGTVRRVFDGVRAAADGYGYTLPPGQLGWALPVFVADTDAAAEAIALPALDTLFNKLMRMPKDLFFPAGYTSAASAARILAAKGGLGSGRAGRARAGRARVRRDRLAGHGAVQAGGLPEGAGLREPVHVAPVRQPRSRGLQGQPRPVRAQGDARAPASRRRLTP